MKRLERGTVIALTAVLIAAPAMADQPMQHVVTEPKLEVPPNADELVRFYPEKAQSLGVTGSAAIDCEVTRTHQVRDCKVQSETPAEYGFGRAAIEIAQFMRFSPRLIDGAPQDGGRKIFRIKFALPEASEPTAWFTMKVHWLKQPTLEQIRAAYPAGSDAGGTAQLACQANGDGTLGDCGVMSEFPVGSGLGKAALGLARYFNAGKPPPGPDVMVIVPVAFPKR